MTGRSRLCWSPVVTEEGDKGARLGDTSHCVPFYIFWFLNQASVLPVQNITLNSKAAEQLVSDCSFVSCK